MLKVSEPLFMGNEKKYLCEAIDAGEISSKGSFVPKFEEAFAKWSGNKYAIAVSSGIGALETAIWALKIKKILIPNWTIISCPIAAIRAGAMPKFYENRPKQGDIMRCHLFGHFDGNAYSDKVVDDCSQYWEPYTVPDIGCYSLYANKLITSGEGGVIVTNREDIYFRARRYRDLCRMEDRFIHSAIGYNFRMSNLQAAVALAQLEQIDRAVEIKQLNRDSYKKHLPDNTFGDSKILFDTPVPWMYLVKTEYDAGEVVRQMGKLGVECRRHFYPLDKQPCFKKYQLSVEEQFTIADDLWDHAFYLPSGLTLTEGDIIDVCGKLREVLRSLKSK